MRLILPAKRERVRSGIMRGPKLEWPKHRAFIRRHTCVVTVGKGHDECSGSIQCCHRRTAANSGTSMKPGDWETWPGCLKHHAEQHRGEKTFEKKYGLDLAAICKEFVRLSTDQDMRNAMREYGLL